MNLGMVGGGRAAWAFGSAWKGLGRTVLGVTARSSPTVAELLGVSSLPLEELVPASDLILVAVTDSAMIDVAARVVPLLSSDAAVFHPSGSLSSEVFSPHPHAFSLHPLRSLPKIGEPCDFAGTLFTFEGAADSRRIARDFVDQVGGRFSEIRKEQKPLYHAAAVFASNYVEALLEIARATMRDAGVVEDVRNELSALARSAIENWLGGEFTGPVARGDRILIDKHVTALAHNQEHADLYRLLAAALAKALQQKGF